MQVAAYFRIEERKVIESGSLSHREWVIAEVVIDWDLWGPAASSEAKIIGRLLVSRLTLHFGRQQEDYRGLEQIPVLNLNHLVASIELIG